MLKTMHSLMIMSDSRYPAEKTLGILSELAGVSAKMHAIAEQRTVSALMQFMSEISAIVMAASAKKIIFETNIREIASLDTEIARLQEHGEQLAKIIVAEKTGEATPPDPKQTQMPQDVGEALLQLSTRRDKLKEHRQALLAHNEKCREFLEKLGAQVPRKVGLHVAEVTLAVRSELRLAIDGAWYRFQMATNIVKSEMVDDQISGDLEAAVEERDASNPSD